MPRQKLSPLTWLLIAVVGYVIGVSALYFFVLRPLFNEAEQVKQESLVAEEYMVLQNTATQLALFKNRVVVRNRLTAVRAALDSLAIPVNVDITDVSADTAATERLNLGFQLKAFRVTVEGQYPGLNAFLAELEQPNNYYAVTNLTIIRIAERTGRARAQLRLRALTVKAQKGIAPANSVSGN